MKLLLDENLPDKMRHDLSDHQVFTTGFMKWKGIENGELLALAAAASFDGVITNDRGLEYEQNLLTLPISIVVLLIKSNEMTDIRPLYPALKEALAQLKPRTFVKVAPFGRATN